MEHNMRLTPDEEAILNGEQGEALAKVMKTLVLYGDAFGAEQFVDVSGPAHLVTSFGLNVLKPVFAIMDELIAGGVKAKLPFTVDPRPDFTNIKSGLLENLVFTKIMYGMQEAYDAQLIKLGLKNSNAYTCTCYHEEVGNIPKYGDILSWAESSAVVYANSVIGARSNRNSGIIELFGAILGKVPCFDLLTDEGRQAQWIIEVKTTKRPEAQVLGSAIGMKVMEDVPFVRGLGQFLGGELTGEVKDYLKDFGAAAASNGAVGLYHIEGLTPEAVEKGESLIAEGAKTYVIDDAELERVKAGYPVIWKNKEAKPVRCFIGCPHLSYSQLDAWVKKFGAELEKQGKAQVGLITVFTAAPDVIERFKTENMDAYGKLLRYGIKISGFCPLMYMNNPLAEKKPVITNSNKLRTYTSARYYTDDEIVAIAVKGGF